MLAAKALVSAVGRVAGASCLGLHAEAAQAALQDAGLRPGDIDDAFCAYSIPQPHLMLASVLSGFFGITPAMALRCGSCGARRRRDR